VKAIERADVVVVPTRIGGVETARAEAVLDLVPRKVPVGLVICSARTYTRDYQDVVAAWSEAGIAVWGSVPERVTIATGPEGSLSPDGMDAYRSVWRRTLRAVRES
jgi:chromosome partitioning protein